MEMHSPLLPPLSNAKNCISYAALQLLLQFTAFFSALLCSAFLCIVLHHERWISSWPSINYSVVLPLLLQDIAPWQFKFWTISFFVNLRGIYTSPLPLSATNTLYLLTPPPPSLSWSQKMKREEMKSSLKTKVQKVRANLVLKWKIWWGWTAPCSSLELVL